MINIDVSWLCQLDLVENTTCKDLDKKYYDDTKLTLPRGPDCLCTSSKQFVRMKTLVKLRNSRDVRKEDIEWKMKNRKD